jgi:hypothetical protein
MTEAEWLDCTDPTVMLGFARQWRSGSSDRKLRLFACALCRRLEDRSIDAEGRRAIDVMERLADGLATEEERLSVGLRAVRPTRMSPYADFARSLTDADAWAAAWGVAIFTAGVVALPQLREGTWVPYTDPQGCRLLRDLFDNPFRPAAVVPKSVLRWDGGIVPKLAQAIYEDKAFERLPVLGDALEEAGWADEAGLRHCRQPGEHVRGCWALDLVLGKA